MSDPNEFRRLDYQMRRGLRPSWVLVRDGRYWCGAGNPQFRDAAQATPYGTRQEARDVQRALGDGWKIEYRATRPVRALPEIIKARRPGSPVRKTVRAAEERREPEQRKDSR